MFLVGSLPLVVLVGQSILTHVLVALIAFLVIAYVISLVIERTKS